MTLALPVLNQTPSPNYSSRGGARVRLIVVHDCEGSYDGSIAWFAQPKSQVSAHIVLSEDGARATQMVAWRNKAWHVCNFNPVSEGIEAAGYAAKGLAAPEWEALAAITAYRLHANGLPPTWSRDGSGEGFCQHLDLGRAGGGHHDITSDPAVWQSFCNMVEKASEQPMPETWGSSSALAPSAPAGWVSPSVRRHDLTFGSVEWVQSSLNALNIQSPLLSPLVVDGIDGPDTRFAVRKFQRANDLAIDGDAGPITCAAIFKALERMKS